MQRYYALGNVVYTEDQKAVFVVAPIWGLKAMADKFADKIATSLNNWASDERDVLRGSLD